jgi:hypothetical protein
VLEQNQDDLYYQPLLDFSRIQSDSSGLDTFDRYIWQAKQIVRQWLTCIAREPGPLFLLCEQVEDLSIVYPDRIRFIQFKTRDRGSWNVSGMCEHGIESLARTYNNALEFGLSPETKIELWLEGPIGDSSKVQKFVKNPSDADLDTRRQLCNLGVKEHNLDDFLNRLIIRPGQPSRSHIDAVAIREIGALWPALSQGELEYIYQQLLTAASAAQSGEPTPTTIYPHLIRAQSRLHPGTAVVDFSFLPELQQLANQILSRDMITALTPPRAEESNDELLNRISNGSHASLLELKMARSGADSEIIMQAKELRAEMEIQRQLLIASREPSSIDTAFSNLSKRILVTAKATARRVDMLGASNPTAASRPATAIASELLSHPANLANCDRERIFESDGHILYGYLCHLSDQCDFEWRHT